MKIALGMKPEKETVIEGYSTMVLAQNDYKIYEPEHLPALLDALEAFKKFVRD